MSVLGPTIASTSRPSPPDLGCVVSAAAVKARVGRYWPRPAADRQSFRYVRGLTVPDRQAAVRTVVDLVLPRACHGQRVAAYVLITHLVLAPSGAGFHAELGRDYLATQAGCAQRTVSTMLAVLRAARLIHTPRRGRQGQGCSIMAASAELLHQVADVARAAGAARKGAGFTAKRLGRNTFQRATGGTNDTPPKFPVGAAAPPDSPAASPEVVKGYMAQVRAMLAPPDRPRR